MEYLLDFNKNMRIKLFNYLIKTYLKDIVDSQQLPLFNIDDSYQNASLSNTFLNIKKINEYLFMFKIPLLCYEAKIKELVIHVPWNKISSEKCWAHLSNVEINMELNSHLQHDFQSKANYITNPVRVDSEDSNEAKSFSDRYEFIKLGIINIEKLVGKIFDDFMLFGTNINIIIKIKTSYNELDIKIVIPGFEVKSVNKIVNLENSVKDLKKINLPFGFNIYADYIEHENNSDFFTRILKVPIPINQPTMKTKDKGYSFNFILLLCHESIQFELMTLFDKTSNNINHFNITGQFDNLLLFLPVSHQYIIFTIIYYISHEFSLQNNLKENNIPNTPSTDATNSVTSTKDKNTTYNICLQVSNVSLYFHDKNHKLLIDDLLKHNYCTFKDMVLTRESSETSEYLQDRFLLCLKFDKINIKKNTSITEQHLQSYNFNIEIYSICFTHYTDELLTEKSFVFRISDIILIKYEKIYDWERNISKKYYINIPNLELNIFQSAHPLFKSTVDSMGRFVSSVVSNHWHLKNELKLPFCSTLMITPMSFMLNIKSIDFKYSFATAIQNSNNIWNKYLMNIVTGNISTEVKAIQGKSTALIGVQSFLFQIKNHTRNENIVHLHLEHSEYQTYSSLPVIKACITRYTSNSLYYSAYSSTEYAPKNLDPSQNIADLKFKKLNNKKRMFLQKINYKTYSYSNPARIEHFNKNLKKILYHSSLIVTADISTIRLNLLKIDSIQVIYFLALITTETNKYFTCFNLGCNFTVSDPPPSSSLLRENKTLSEFNLDFIGNVEKLVLSFPDTSFLYIVRVDYMNVNASFSTSNVFAYVKSKSFEVSIQDVESIDNNISNQGEVVRPFIYLNKNTELHEFALLASIMLSFKYKENKMHFSISLSNACLNFYEITNSFYNGISILNLFIPYPDLFDRKCDINNKIKLSVTLTHFDLIFKFKEIPEYFCVCSYKEFIVFTNMFCSTDKFILLFQDVQYYTSSANKSSDISKKTNIVMLKCSFVEVILFIKSDVNNHLSIIIDNLMIGGSFDLIEFNLISLNHLLVDFLTDFSVSPVEESLEDQKINNNKMLNEDKSPNNVNSISHLSGRSEINNIQHDIPNNQTKNCSAKKVLQIPTNEEDFEIISDINYCKTKSPKPSMKLEYLSEINIEHNYLDNPGNKYLRHLEHKHKWRIYLRISSCNIYLNEGSDLKRWESTNSVPDKLLNYFSLSFVDIKIGNTVMKYYENFNEETNKLKSRSAKMKIHEYKIMDKNKSSLFPIVIEQQTAHICPFREKNTFELQIDNSSNMIGDFSDFSIVLSMNPLQIKIDQLHCSTFKLGARHDNTQTVYYEIILTILYETLQKRK